MMLVQVGQNTDDRPGFPAGMEPPMIEAPAAPLRAASLLTPTHLPSSEVMLAGGLTPRQTASTAAGGAGAGARARPRDLVKQPLQGAASSGAGRGHTAQPVRLPARNRWGPHPGAPARPTRHGYLALPRLRPGQSDSRARRRTPGDRRPANTGARPRMVSTCRHRQSPTATRPG